MENQADPEQLLCNENGVIWLFYSQCFLSNYQNDRILQLYKELEITLPKGVLSNSDQIQAAFQSSIIQRTQFIKFAIIGQIKSKNSKNMLTKIGKHKQFVSINYLQDELQLVLKQSFSQMKELTFQLTLKSIFHLIVQNQKQDLFLKLITLYACSTDEFCDRQSFLKVYKENFGSVTLPKKSQGIMQKYLTSQTLRSYLQAKMSKINDQKDAVEIGYLVRKISSFIKNNSVKISLEKGGFLNKLYKKQIRWSEEYFKYLNKGSIYCMSTIQKFTKSQYFKAQSLLQIYKQKKSVFAVIIISTECQGSNQVNNGIYQTDNQGIFNCLNYFQFIQITRKEHQNQSIDVIFYQIEFRMISEQYWKKSLSNIDSGDASLGGQVDFLYRIFQFLQQNDNKIGLEDSFIHSHNYQKTQLIITKKIDKNISVSSQHCEKIGIVPAQLSNSTKCQGSTIKQTTKSYKIAKGFRRFYYLVSVLKKQIQLLSQQNTNPNFNKCFIQKSQKRLQLSILMNQMPSFQKHCCLQLNQIYKDIQRLAGLLSHSNIESIDVVEAQKGCFSCFFKGRPSSQEETRQKNDKILEQYLFKDLQNPDSRSQNLIHLKQQLVKLYSQFQKGILNINRFGNLSEDFIQFFNLFTKNQSLKRDIQILKSSKKKSKNNIFDDGNNDQSFLLKKDSDISTLQSEIYNHFQNLKSFNKFHRGDSLNNSIQSLRETRSSLQQAKKKSRKIEIQLENALKDNENNFSEQNSKKYKWTCELYAKSLLLSIQVLKQQNYTVNSLKMMNLFRKLANVYVKTRNIIQLQKLTNLQFLEQQHSLTLKAQLQSDLAHLAYRKKEFNLSQALIEKACKLLTRLTDKTQNDQKKIVQDKDYIRSINNKKIIDLKVLSFKVFYNKLKHQRKMPDIQNLLNRIDQFRKKEEKKIGSTKFKIYRIDLNLLNNMIAQIQIQLIEKQEKNNPNHSQENSSMKMRYKIIDQSIKLMKDIQQIYGISIQYALILIDILTKRHNMRHISSEHHFSQDLQAKIQQFFNIIEQIFNNQQPQGEQKVKYSWILWLSRFFKERQNNKKLFQISQSRRLIEGCLHEFKKLKLMDRMDTDLEGYYQTIYSLYLKFMRKYLKAFPTRENILLLNEEKDDIRHIEKNDSSAQSKKKRYLYEVVWLFCIKSQQWGADILQMLRQKQSQRILMKNSISCISNSFQLLFESIARLRNQGNYIIKGVIESRMIKNYGQNKIIAKLKQLDKITIIMDVQEVRQYLMINLLNNKIQQKVKIIQKKQLMQIKQLLKQFEDDMDFQYDTNRNTIFFQKQYYREKIINYHTIIHSCISHAVNFQLLKKQTPLEAYKQIAIKFCQKNKRTQHLTGKDMIETINKLFKYKKSFDDCIQELSAGPFQDSIQAIKQKMITCSNEIINIYRVENIYYHLVNYNLRILYEIPERIKWQDFQPYIYLLYHSILILSSKQRKQVRNWEQKLFRLWRLVEMKQEEYQSYMEVYSKKNSYIKYMSFLSTSSSFEWIQKQLQRRIKDNPEQIKKYAIIQIQLTVDENQQYQMIHNGFVTIFNSKESETLFNILNVFQIEQVSKVAIDQIAPESVEVMKIFERRQIIYIKQKFIKNLSHLLQSKQISPPIQYFFNFQFEFNRLRSHYQKYRQNIVLRQFRISSYSLIEAYMDMGALKEAQDLIKFQFERAHNSPLDFMEAIFGNDQNPQNSKNLLHKLIEIYMKKGEHRTAERLFTDYDKQLKEIKQLIRQQANKRLLAQKSYQLKKQMIEIFKQQVNIEQYQNKICDIQKDINRLDESTDENRIKKTQQIIYLHLHKSIYYFQKNKIQDSLKNFKVTLQKIKQICYPSSFFDKITKYCQNIIKGLRTLFGRYQTLNKNHFKQKIEELAASFMETIQRVNQKQNKQYSDTQVNLYCCQTAAETIKSQQQNVFQSQISNIAQNIEIQSQASDNIDNQISMNPGLQHYKENIKTINFCLLGKVQSQKERVANCSLNDMKIYMNKFQRLEQKLNLYRKQDLKSRGFEQKSIELIRLKRKSARSALSKMNSEQFYYHIEAIFMYCQKKQSHELEQCRTLILEAQFDQIKLKKKLMAHNYRMEGQDIQIFQKIHKTLNYAQTKLKQVYSKGQNHNFLSSVIRDTDNIKSKSHQHLAIQMLRVKVAYQQYFQTKNDSSDLAKNRKELLHKALDQLEMAIANREKTFNVLNEEIYLYNIRSQFSILIIKKPKQFQDYFSKFKKGIAKRRNFRGVNSIENAIDCIELLEIFDVFQDQSIMSKVSQDDRDKLYLYVKEGARSSENNSLFWRFIRCMFTRITRKSYKNNEEYAIAKLEFIQKALRQIKILKVIDRLSINKMKQTYEKFIKYSKQMRQVQSFDRVQKKKKQILDIILEIENRNMRDNEEAQKNIDQIQLPQHSNKDSKQQIHYFNSSKIKNGAYNQQNPSRQKYSQCQYKTSCPLINNFHLLTVHHRQITGLQPIETYQQINSKPNTDYTFLS